jgi:hypothetical protein
MLDSLSGRIPGAMVNFDYIVDKIQKTDLDFQPFRHLYLENVFRDEDFARITAAPEVDIPPAENDEQLMQELYRHNFKEIEFPGTTTNIARYLAWHSNPKASKNLNQETCEGYGVTVRLQRTSENTILRDADDFFRSDRFWHALQLKFGIGASDVRRDVGLQKYLDGYEISPHPDIRAKALTFMININPSPNAEKLDYHTHYMVFRPEWDYIRVFWSSDTAADRCWVPWDWCISKKTQTRNNSMVIFSPSNDSLHAVKACYDHLTTQRTQFYGNLWYNTTVVKRSPNFRDLAKLAALQTA